MTEREPHPPNIPFAAREYTAAMHPSFARIIARTLSLHDCKRIVFQRLALRIEHHTTGPKSQLTECQQANCTVLHLLLGIQVAMTKRSTKMIGMSQ
eukprot:5134917-Amphidinium_carterae.1